MSEGKADPVWWDVVKTLAGFVITGHNEENIRGLEVRSKLIDSGYCEAEISAAFEWLDKVILSGSLSESLSMLHPRSKGLRVENPLETMFMSETLWKMVQVCRLRGFLNDELIERLLDGISTLDTRDWDDEDASLLIIELLSIILPGHSEEKYRLLLEGDSPEFLC